MPRWLEDSPSRFPLQLRARITGLAEFPLSIAHASAQDPLYSCPLARLRMLMFERRLKRGMKQVEQSAKRLRPKK